MGCSMTWARAPAKGLVVLIRGRPSSSRNSTHCRVVVAATAPTASASAVTVALAIRQPTNNYD